MVTPQPATRSRKFALRRSQILAVASEHINVHGARGMTLTAVAKALDLDTSSVTYYFKRKDVLAAACLEQSLRWLLESAVAAAQEPSPAERSRAFLAAQFDLHRRLREPGAEQLALLSDLATLEGDIRAPLDAIYRDIFETVRGFFAGERRPGEGSRTLIAATHLLATVHWLPGWINRYHVRDFARVEARLADIVLGGLKGAADWPVETAALRGDEDAGDAQTRFLLAATRLINRQGYVGASVEKIAAELGVSTGSFYHHLENKDDLVVACFRRSFDVIARAQTLADAKGQNEGERLAIMASGLIAMQLSEETSLLRISAYQALPPDLRERMLHLTGQVTRHIAGTVADGVSDGSLRACDPMIASQTVMAVINAAADLRRWAETRELEEAVSAYLQPLRTGLCG